MTEEPNKGGRPPVNLTDAQRIEVGELARVGMSMDLIADHLGVARSTLYLLRDRDEALAREYARGLALGLAEIHRTAFDEAKAGNPAMLQLILKTKGGWRETPQSIEVSGPDGKPIQTEDVTRDVESFTGRMARLAAAASGGGDGSADAGGEG